MNSLDTDPNCVLHRLKTGTFQHHEDIENSIPVMSETLTTEQYLEILKSFYGFFRSFEAVLAQFPKLAEFVPDLGARQKLHLLEKDLRYFSIEPNSIPVLPVATLTMSDRSEREANLFAAFGALYVMEGSTLGGQVISRRLKSHLGLTVEKGAAFYNAYGSETGKMWQNFKGFLKAHVTSEAQKDVAVRGAQNTFSTLQRWMER